MSRRQTAILASFVLLIGACDVAPPELNEAELEKHVWSNFDADAARSHVRQLEDMWRWSGNRDFDRALDYIAEQLELDGYVEQSAASDGDRLVYRIENYPKDEPSWQPLDATIRIEGALTPLLSFETNRNMLAVNSHATPPGGISADVVFVSALDELDKIDVRGKIVMADGYMPVVFEKAVLDRGALGVLCYGMPDYTKPERNRNAIQHRSIKREGPAESWGIALSLDAREELLAMLEEGPVTVSVETAVEWNATAVERSVIAEIRGSGASGEEFVFSGHVDEPGANDNGSGIATLLEIAGTAAKLAKDNFVIPKRGIVMIWGEEFSSTERYMQQSAVSKRSVRWGMSLDMVGQDTSRTGGTFLVEKMPDPSAIWPRGDESFSEWGGKSISKDELAPHYLNDFVLNRAGRRAKFADWLIKTNPFEGGSDHVPFLDHGVASVLLWHFTDQYYHTDLDRLDMVSANEMANVGTTALMVAYLLASANEALALQVVAEVHAAARARLDRETSLSIAAIGEGAAHDAEQDILETWARWYDGAIESTSDIEIGNTSSGTRASIEQAKADVAQTLTDSLTALDRATSGDPY